MEHWLPLFYDDLETLFDYLPTAVVTLDGQAAEARDARVESITDFFQARQTMENTAEGGWVYKPVPMQRLFLSVEDWDGILSKRPVTQFSGFTLPDHLENLIEVEGKQGKDFSEARNREDVNVFDEVSEYIRLQQTNGKKIIVTGFSDGSRDRLISMFHEHGLTNTDVLKDWKIHKKTMRKQVQFLTLGLERGVITPNVVFITEQDILGERLARAQKRRRKSDNFLKEVSSLQDKDFVVHMEHGIGQYIGLETVDVGGAPHDCLKVVYSGGDKLFVPVENIEILSRYGFGRLWCGTGSSGWCSLAGQKKARVKERIREIAHQLIGIAANRLLRKAETIDVPEGLYDEFAARFPYPETEDQLNAIADVFEDLRSGRPMDRLVCGDVGFGKTEVALRAAFVAVMSGKQVAVVVPTTLLARQHYNNFVERFKGLPVRIGQLSRLATSKEQTETKKGLAEGTVEIVVGTHAVFAKKYEIL